jgi:hypothetical protein
MIWVLLCRVLAGIWRGLASAVTWPHRKAAALSIEEWASLRAGELAPRRGLGEDGEPAAACEHRDAESVDLVTGERVAWWCEACGTQLAADFTPPKPAALAGDGRRATVEAVYCQALATPARYTVTGSWGRRHWHADPAGCASCAGSDASGSRWCLCGRCVAAAAASVMGPPG